MRISELLGSEVADERGNRVGRVYDLRLRAANGRRRGPSFEVVGLIVGPAGPLGWAAHAWGYAEGRAQGPWLLRAATRRAIRASRFVPADRVLGWEPGELRIGGSANELEPLAGGDAR